MTQYWLLKSEPTTFSIDDLAASPNQTTCWEGVRNYQARNFLKSMQVGDQGFFYHSNADPTAIVGRVEVVKAAYPDPYAFDAHSRYFDATSTREHPRWFVVDIRFLEKFPEPLSLSHLRTIKALQHMELLRKGSRLSVQPVKTAEWECILKLGSSGRKRVV
ncbi:MAG: EVE domain-containing protein [Nitrospirales bacterium]|nr:EVE domain-containing protein [Nitrospirales bacterium]